MASNLKVRVSDQVTQLPNVAPHYFAHLGATAGSVFHGESGARTQHRTAKKSEETEEPQLGLH